MYLKNWPFTGSTATQWTTFSVKNPSSTPVSVSFTVHRIDGSQPPLGVISKTIPAYGGYSSYGDTAWDAVASSDPTLSRSIGWIELSSSLPVVATSRLSVRMGNTSTSPVILFSDDPFLKKPATRLLSSYYFKRWPTGDNRTQWTDLLLNNPSSSPAQVTVRVHRWDGGGVLASVPVVVPARGLWNSYGKAAWLNIPDTHSYGGIGWTEVISDLPIVATMRVRFNDGSNYNSPTSLLDEIGLVPSGHYVLRAHRFLKGVQVTGKPLTQWSNLLVANANPTPANITILVYRPDGILASPGFSAVVPAMGTWNSYQQPQWQNASTASGWVEIRSDQPLFGINRVAFRNGTSATDPIALLDEEPLTTASARRLHGWIYLRNCATNNTGITQWSNVAVHNPRSEPVTITVRVMSSNGVGEVIPSFSRTIPAKGLWGSFGDTSWFPAETPAAGWVEITSTAPVLGSNRITLREGTTSTSPVFRFDESALDGNSDRERDLLVGWISREPAIDYVWGNSNPAVEGWPDNGEPVTWRAHVRNKSAAASNAVPYRWSIDGVIVATGSVNLPAEGMATVDLPWVWSFSRRQIRFSIDPYNGIPEAEEGNNELTIDSDAISAGLWVEQSVYDYFDEHQHELMAGSSSWEDWAQRQVRTWNQMFADSIYYPETPYGVLDRIRLDKIVLVPDGALPLSGGLPTNHPDLDDRSVDLQWGFPKTASLPVFYADHETQDRNNPFYYEASLLHELGHARYLTDVYGFNVHVNLDNQIDIREGGVPIVGTKYMPLITPDTVHFTPYTGLMNGNGPLVDRPSAAALNLIRGHRATLGNYNAPGNLGVYLNDLPAQNEVTVIDQDTLSRLPGASVQIFRAGPGGDAWYTKHYDAIPDLSLTADGYGRVLLGRCPFSASPECIVHGHGRSNGVLIVRVQYGSRVGYGFLESQAFNLQYWSGNTTTGRYRLAVKLQP